MSSANTTTKKLWPSSAEAPGTDRETLRTSIPPIETNTEGVSSEDNNDIQDTAPWRSVGTHKLQQRGDASSPRRQTPNRVWTPDSVVDNSTTNVLRGGEEKDSESSCNFNNAAHMGELSRNIRMIAIEITQLEKDIADMQDAAAATRTAVATAAATTATSARGEDTGVSETFTIGNDGEVLYEKERRLLRETDHLMEKEKQLREEKRQLREEKLLVLRATLKPEERLPEEVPPRRISMLMTSACVDDPKGEALENRRLSKVSEVIKSRRSTPSMGLGAWANGQTLVQVYKQEEDSRLLTRLGSYANPILVSTLLAGFCLVLFEIATREITQQLAVLSFALEMAASIVMSGIVFHGQQVYSYATDIDPRTRRFLHKMRPVTVCALSFFAVGVVTFVAAFILEASDNLGKSWMTLVAVVFFPSIIAGMLFIATVMVMRRTSMKMSE